MKLPNGYGTVTKLSGNRRKTWRVRKTAGWEVIDGQIRQKFINIGCYATRAEAIKALAEYNANPYDIDAARLTFEEVYERWSAIKYEKIGDSNVNGYKAAYKLCAAIKDIKFADLKLSHLQSVVDSSGKNHPTLRKLKNLFSQMYQFAVMHDIVTKEKNVVEFLDIGEPTQSDKHYRFTDEEVATLWRWSSGNEYVQVILILIYTGARPGEIFAVKKENVNLEERYIYIEKGKNENAARRIPIHDRILPFIEERMRRPDAEYLITQRNGREFRFAKNHGQYVDSYWKPLLEDMGIYRYKNEKGILREHTPDDTRHTFTTMWKEKKLDEAMRRKIQGHSGKGIGEIVYTHFEFELLRAELNKL